MTNTYRTPRQKAVRRDIKNTLLLLAVAVPVIIMIACVNYAAYSAHVCETVPNHYTCTGN